MMNSSSINFFLVPDGPSARRVKIRLASEAPGLYRMVGTWPELMAQAMAAYLLAPTDYDWHDKLRQMAHKRKDAFWSQSLSVAARETISELDNSSWRLLEAKGPGSDLKPLVDKVTSHPRIHGRLQDLIGLLETIDGLPGAMQEMADFLGTQHRPLRSIRVYRDDRLIDFNPWQRAVLDKLDRDAPAPDPRLQSILNDSLSAPVTSNPALTAARRLYSSSSEPPPAQIDTVRVLAVRDSLAEAEIAAGMIQNAVANGSLLTDMGLLLPNDPLCLVAVENVFKRCGLPLAGFRRSMAQRDLGRETLHSFLLCLRKPAPIMAVAALLTSPLMPWSAEQGQDMAQAVMNGDVRLKSTSVPSAALRLMDEINAGPATPAELRSQLNQFNRLMTEQEVAPEHIQRAKEAIQSLQTALSAATELDWDILLYLVTPESMSMAHPAEFWQDAIPVFHEGTLPWCSVAHLFVLGFNDGHFPGGAGTSAVFSDAEWETIGRAGLPVLTNDLLRKRQRALFAEQLSAATKRLTLLHARRDACGKSLEPSSSLIFLSRSLGVDPEAIILDIDRTKEAKKVTDLAQANKALPSPPRELAADDIELGRDLLETFGRGDGELAPLSPSAADTLMVSPFAWLLGRLGCDPRAWGTDDFDVLKAGTLAHRVFEELFEAGQPLPDEKMITEQVPVILREKVLQVVPFLRNPEWRVERFKFESEVLRAAVHWKKLLASCNASIVAAEQWLRGSYGDVPLHGQSDLLVKLPTGKLLVVDYKKSSSGKRRERMRSGFDLQAHLYRLMIHTGGLPEFESTPDDIGIVYYLLNDTTALADGAVGSDGSTPGWEELSNDISSQAMVYLDRRLADIRKGTVRLNTTEDEQWWSTNAGLTIYALDNSPLLRLFLHIEEDT